MRIALLSLWLITVGCVEPCIRHSDCPNQLVCQLGGCVMATVDGDVPDGVVPDGEVPNGDAAMDMATADSSVDDSGMDDAGTGRLLDVEFFVDAALDVPLMDGSLSDTGADDGPAEVGPSDAEVDASLFDAGDGT